jgi:DNA-binding transcriptional ArsR family regulator
MSLAMSDRPRAASYPVPTVPAASDQRKVVQELIEKVTVANSPCVLIWDLKGRFLEAGALYELVVPLSEAVRERRLGQYAIVVATRDEPTIDVLRALAIRHDLPLFITPDANALDAAQPATEMTPSRAAIFRAVSSAGIATVASIASSVGVGHTSASNALSDLADEGLLFRQEGSGRRGHVYFHPKSAIPSGSPADEAVVDDLPLPRALIDDLVAAAEGLGRRPEELLAEAWREYQLSRRSDLAAQYQKMAHLVRSGDREALHAAVSRRSRAKAEQAARRPRG